MNEKTLREQTKQLLQAYEELVEREHRPSVQEFLLLRSRAMEEGGELEAARAITKTVSALNSRPDTPVSDRAHRSTQPSPQRNLPPFHDLTGEPRNERTFPITSEAPREPEDHILSDYDILRGLRDPWND